MYVRYPPLEGGLLFQHILSSVVGQLDMITFLDVNSYVVTFNVDKLVITIITVSVTCS